MNVKFFLVAIGIVATLILSGANFAEARGFGSRGGASIRIGTGGSSNRAGRYYGPSFSVTPRIGDSYQQGSSQLQQRPWYYSRSGPVTYYRPYSTYYSPR